MIPFSVFLSDLRVQRERRCGDGWEELLRHSERSAARCESPDRCDRFSEDLQDTRQAVHWSIRPRHRRSDPVSQYPPLIHCSTRESTLFFRGNLFE